MIILQEKIQDGIDKDLFGNVCTASNNNENTFTMKDLNEAIKSLRKNPICVPLKIEAIENPPSHIRRNGFETMIVNRIGGKIHDQ